MPLDILTGEAVRALVSIEDCIELMAGTMREVSNGEVTIPPRGVVALKLDDNLFLDMPGATAAGFGSKLLGYFPGNTRQPTIQGVIVLFDAATGAPRAVVDAVSVTAIRTAAASGLATKLLAHEGISTLALLGTGLQAEWHLRAMRAVRPIERVLVWGRSLEKAEAFAARHRAAGLRIAAVPQAQSAVEMADIVCTVTASPTPVLEGRWLNPGAHLNLVGAFTPTTREADTEAIRRSRLFVEIRDFALREAGELVIPIAEGAITAAHVAGEIGEVVAGTVAGRTNIESITAYKSLGNVAQDLATAAFACEQAAKRPVPGVTRIADFG
jgi:ornithine cyclodeaminase